jgi:glycosyltransferase EpsF
VKTSRSKAKIVAHAHSAMYPSVMKRTMAYASSIARKLMYFFVDEYIACSDLAAKYAFPNKIYVNKRYRIINNGIETDKFVFNSDKRQNVREKLCVDDNTLVVGHIGRFSNEKNHSFLIDVFNQILKININAVLILIGSGYLKENIENKAIKLGIVDKIIFIGAAKQQDVIGYYQAMDVFVLPSLYEGFPVVGVEAQVAGVPMVVSDTITKEMDFTGNVIYLSLKEEVSLWADKIIKMACVERKSYDSEAICRGFDVKCTAKSLMEFYDEIIL